MAEVILSLVTFAQFAVSQTAPTPQTLPYGQDFGNSTFTSPPIGMVAWGGMSGSSINSVNAAGSSVPTADATIAAATTSQTAGGCFGLSSSGNARFYVQTSSNTSNGTNQLALALDTRGLTGITLGYDVEIISAQPRTVGVVCQCRSSTTGSWTTISPAQGLNPFSQSGGTTGLKTTVQAVLPTLADDQPVVQIRWAVWRGTESGNSSGLAIDNISATATTVSNTLSIQVTPSTVLESAGLSAATVTVTTGTPVTEDLPVTLSSSDSTEIVVGEPVRIIPAGMTSAMFQLNAINDDLVDGTQIVTLLAGAPGASAVSTSISVADDEDPYSPPPGYYAPASGLTGSALKSALKTIVATGHLAVPYGDTLAPLRVLDADPSNSANILTVYSGVSVPRNDVYRPSAGLDSDSYWSREHIWPASFGLDPDDINPGSTGGDAGPDYPDLHNLRPELQTINSTRGNLYYDETSGSPVVPPLAPLCSRDTDSWEPPDALKGDLARVALYMATRYDGTDGLTTDLELGQTPSTSASRFAKLATLLLWSENDPVSQAERRRNHLVQGYQGNRNPFVDHPEYVAQIWGGIQLSKSGLSVSEGGLTDSFSLVLTAGPTSDVTIVVQPDSGGRTSALPGTLTFTSANWNTPQMVTIAAVDDALHQPTETVTLSHTVTSGDPRYSGFAVPLVSVEVTDNDPLIPPTSLPITFGGPWLPLPTGYLGTGVGTYSTSLGGDTQTGSCKFDDTGDRLVISFTAAPGQLGYRLKGQPGTGTLTTGTFAVEESADGLIWTTVRTVVNKSNADEAFSDRLKPGSRFVAFTYQSKIAGNLQLDAVTIDAATALTGWSAWLSASQLTGADADEASDPDRDGLANLIEYVLGGSPQANSSALKPACSVNGSDLVLTFTRADVSESDTVQSVEWTEDFATWTSIAVGAASGGQVVVDERGTDADQITVSIPLAAGLNRRIFARLKVVKP